MRDAVDRGFHSRLQLARLFSVRFDCPVDQFVPSGCAVDLAGQTVHSAGSTVDHPVDPSFPYRLP